MEQFFWQVFRHKIKVSKLCGVCSRTVSLHLLSSQIPGLPPLFTFVHFQNDLLFYLDQLAWAYQLPD